MKKILLLLLALMSLLVSAAEPRRIIGYFAEWRHGNNGLPSYLVSDIPWDKVTHINYAFATVDETTNRIAFGDRAAAIEYEFPGQSDRYPYRGHFNLLNTYKEQHPNVKTLIAVGGWAASRGFYTMAETAAGRETFADSAVAFMREYGFDGLDIDYEYPTSTSQAGNPNDFDVAEPRRGRLFKDYVELMRLLREKLDQAGAQDGRHYLLTVAAPASSWILGGMMLGEYAQYLDFINMMTYDFHGSWNGFVGHNSAIRPDDRDPETKPLGVSVLNVDWAYRYYRGVVPPSKINMGIPYYSRGWRNVNKGTLPGGLYGSAAQSDGGAMGIDNIWHDKDDNGNEIPAGANPLWHLKNLINNTENLSYASAWGFDPTLVGTYERFYDPVCEVPYIWNDQKRVFLSHEDEESMRNRIDYVVETGLGGVMFWEFSGDYELQPNGEYNMGSTLTSLAHSLLQNAGPADDRMTSFTLPSETADYEVTFGGNYDHPNYTFALTLTNHSAEAIDPGWKLGFSLPKTTTLNSVWGATFTKVGEHDDYQRYEITGPGWQSLPAGASTTLQGMMKLTFSGGPRFLVLNGKASSYEAQPADQAPVANAGPDAEYTAPAQILLDGSDSYDPENASLAYLWEQTSGPMVDLMNDRGAVAEFSVGELTQETVYTFRLTVDDGNLQGEDTVRIIVRPAGMNRAPIADAGPDAQYETPVRVVLDGSRSSDPDQDVLTYLWRQLDGAPVDLLRADTSMAEFTATEVAVSETATFELTVNDGELSHTDQVVITLLPPRRNQAPIARAGDDQTVNGNSNASLDAGASSDPDGDVLSFLWDVPNGITVADPAAARISFVTPEVTVDTTYEFIVTVSDGELTDSDIVIVTVRASSPCDTGPDPADFPAWDAGTVYNTGDRVSFDGVVWSARWWTRNEQPGSSQVWESQSASEQWDPSKAYQGGAEVNHGEFRYRARWWTQGEDPATSSVWTNIGPSTGC